MSTHSRGPWFIDPICPDEIRAPFGGHQAGIMIARITCFGAHRVSMQKEANARLICAAPDLLAALDDLLLGGANARENAIAAIVKARGYQ